MLFTQINEIKSLSTAQIRVRLQAMELYEDGMSRNEMLQILINIIISLRSDRFYDNNVLDNMNVQQLLESNNCRSQSSFNQLSIISPEYMTKILVTAEVHHSHNYNPLTKKEA